LRAVRPRLPVGAQDIRRGLALVDIPGRFQVMPGQPTIILDVGHNPHAAGHLVANLGNMAYHPETYAVFGMMADKDIDGVIAHLRNHVDHWICCDLPGPRGASAQMLEDCLHAAGITDLKDPKKGINRTVVCSTTPRYRVQWVPLRLKREEFSRIAFRTGSSFRSPKFGTVTASSMKPSATIIPPAATNGIMYDTPVITAL